MKFKFSFLIFTVSVISAAVFLCTAISHAEGDSSVYRSQIKQYPMHEIEMRKHREKVRKQIKEIIKRKEEYKEIQEKIAKIEDELVELREKAKQYEVDDRETLESMTREFNINRKKILTKLDKVEAKHLDLIERSDRLRSEIAETEKYIQADESRW